MTLCMARQRRFLQIKFKVRKKKKERPQMSQQYCTYRDLLSLRHEADPSEIWLLVRILEPPMVQKIKIIRTTCMVYAHDEATMTRHKSCFSYRRSFLPNPPLKIDTKMSSHVMPTKQWSIGPTGFRHHWQSNEFSVAHLAHYSADLSNFLGCSKLLRYLMKVATVPTLKKPTKKPKK